MKGRDWNEVHQRLERVAAREDRQGALEELFARRARALAAEGSAAPVRTVDTLLFELDGARYGIPVPALKAVEPLTSLSSVPGAHTAIIGVTALRNQVLAVVDLALLLPGGSEARRARYLWLHHHGIDFGLAADAVLGIEALAESDIVRLSGGLISGRALDVNLVDVSALLRALGVELG